MQETNQVGCLLCRQSKICKSGQFKFVLISKGSQSNFLSDGEKRAVLINLKRRM